MNKGDLVDLIHAKVGGTKVAAEEALKATIESISDALFTGDSVTLIGFGTFSVAERSARTGRNPQTGAPIKIAAKKAVKFSPGKALKDGVNNKKAAKKKPAPAPAPAPAKKRKC